jgi:hypothetical protein
MSRVSTASSIHGDVERVMGETDRSRREEGIQFSCRYH